MARWCGLWQRGLALAAVGLTLAACTRLPTANVELSRQVADRIAAVGQGQEWYAALKLVDSRPDVAWDGPDTYYVQVTLATGVDPGTSASARTCKAVLDAITNPEHGTPFPVDEVELDSDKYSHECWIPGAVDSPVRPT